MGFISKWLFKAVKREEENRNVKVRGQAVGEEPSEVSNFGRPLNITVYNANGGKIVTFRSYDRHTERSNEATYIIHPDELFAESLGKLIAMEEIKRV